MSRVTTQQVIERAESMGIKVQVWGTPTCYKFAYDTYAAFSTCGAQAAMDCLTAYAAGYKAGKERRDDAEQ